MIPTPSVVIKDGLAKAFGLDEDRHVPVLLIALGKANEEGFESVRLDASDVTTLLNDNKRP